MNSYREYIVRDARSYLSILNSTSDLNNQDINRICSHIGFELIEKFLKYNICEIYNVDVLKKESFVKLGIVTSIGVNSVLKSHDILNLYNLCKGSLDKDYLDIIVEVISNIKGIYINNRYPNTAGVVKVEYTTLLSIQVLATKVLNDFQ
ncbi:MAG: hypothetical protein ACRC28_17380 [Clostridium sp.]|uniref:hypothetical protein n=1 Tax=Clostridium sp. TaxID=1506 RepID=UPI003F34534B